MNIQTTFSAQELSAYLRALGWTQVEAARKDGLFLFKNSTFEGRQLLFGEDESFDDYDEALENAARKLADLYEKPFLETVRLIEEANSEVLQSRVPDQNRRVATVPFVYACRVMESQRDLLLSGAIAIGRYQTHYAKTSIGDAKRLLESAQFRQTEQGSFIFKTSCNLYEFEQTDERPLDLLAQEPIAAPFVRRAMLNIGTGLDELSRSIRAHQEEKLVASIKADDESPISANFCDALAKLRDREHPRDVEIRVNYAPILAPPPNTPRQAVLFVPDDFPTIQNIANELRAAQKPKRDSYAATVDKLEGTFNEMGQRQGRILLTLKTGAEGTISGPTQVRVVLDAPKYDQAVEIHKSTRVVARVEGIIKPSRRQPFDFDLISFTIINAPSPSGTY